MSATHAYHFNLKAQGEFCILIYSFGWEKEKS